MTVQLLGTYSFDAATAPNNGFSRSLGTVTVPADATSMVSYVVAHNPVTEVTTFDGRVRVGGQYPSTYYVETWGTARITRQYHLVGRLPTGEQTLTVESGGDYTSPRSVTVAFFKGDPITVYAGADHTGGVQSAGGVKQGVFWYGSSAAINAATATAPSSVTQVVRGSTGTEAAGSSVTQRAMFLATTTHATNPAAFTLPTNGTTMRRYVIAMADAARARLAEAEVTLSATVSSTLRPAVSNIVAPSTSAPKVVTFGPLSAPGQEYIDVDFEIPEDTSVIWASNGFRWAENTGTPPGGTTNSGDLMVITQAGRDDAPGFYRTGYQATGILRNSAAWERSYEEFRPGPARLRIATEGTTAACSVVIVMARGQVAGSPVSKRLGRNGLGDLFEDAGHRVGAVWSTGSAPPEIQATSGATGRSGSAADGSQYVRGFEVGAASGGRWIAPGPTTSASDDWLIYLPLAPGAARELDATATATLSATRVIRYRRTAAIASTVSVDTTVSSSIRRTAGATGSATLSAAAEASTLPMRFPALSGAGTLTAVVRTRIVRAAAFTAEMTMATTASPAVRAFATATGTLAAKIGVALPASITPDVVLKARAIEAGNRPADVDATADLVAVTEVINEKVPVGAFLDVTATTRASVTSRLIRWRFDPPTVRVRYDTTDPLFRRMSFTVGVSLLKEAGIYRQVVDPTAEEVEAADVAYLGGHAYGVDEHERQALIDAGYGDQVGGVFDA